MAADNSTPPDLAQLDPALSDPAPVDPAMIEEARKLFVGPADFIWAADKIDGLPPITRPEIAFAGRSNVGKSSLINALTGRTSLARTSNTPGRTQQLNFFDIGGRLNLVDMPGYGYAAVSKEKVANWTRLITDYLKGRASLARVYVLIDSRHGLKELDHDILKLLDKSAVSYQVVLTKADEIRAGERETRLATTTAEIATRVAAYPEVLMTSSRTTSGIPELRAAVVKLLRERGS
jgi:GTP-binding protein